MPPLDVVVSFGTNLDFSVHADIVSEFTVRFDDGGIKIPACSNFYFFEDINAIFTAIAVAAFGQVRRPLNRKKARLRIENETP